MIATAQPENFFQQDDFAVTAAEPWVKGKTIILRQYIAAFVAHLSGRVDNITLVDLYSGNGLFSLGSSRQVFPGNAFTALGLDLPINRYVLCEKDSEQFKILKIRINRNFRKKNVLLLEGRPEELIEKLRMYIPPTKSDYRAAVLCICDPFSLDISFDTLLRLADQDFNLLIPYTFALNDRINQNHYLKENRPRVVRFLGGNRDTETLDKSAENNVLFYKKLVQMHQQNMLGAGMNGSFSVHKLDSGLMELPWYYIGFFSKSFSAKAIQQDVESAQHVQFELF